MTELINQAWDTLNKERVLDDFSVGTTTMNVIRCLEEHDLTETQKLLVLENVQRLLRTASTPIKITNEVTKWQLIDTGLHQNVQLQNVFSTDGGQHYYFQNDPMSIFESEKV